MQAKGIIRFFLIALVVACLYQLTFTWAAKNFEKKAEAYAEKMTPDCERLGIADNGTLCKDSTAVLLTRYKRKYLDSVSDEKALNLGFISYTYREVSEKQIRLGLDLQGGMSVVLEVAAEDVLKALAMQNEDENFNKAIENALLAQQQDDRKFVKIFQDEFEKLDPNAQLSTIFAPLENFQERIEFEDDNDAVIKVLETDVDDAVGKTYEVIKTRIDGFGVAQANIQLQEEAGRIIVELPGADNPERIRKILQQTAQLEFWHTYRNADVIGLWDRVNEIIRDKLTIEGEDGDDVAEAGAGEGVDLDVPADDNPDAVEAAESELPDNMNQNAVAADSGNNDSGSLADTDTGFGLPDTGIALDDTTEDQFNPLYNIFQPFFDQQTGAGIGPLVGYALASDIEVINEYLNMPEVRDVLPNDLKLVWTAKPVTTEKNIYGLIALRKDPGLEAAPLTGDVIKLAREGFDQMGSPQVSMNMNGLGADVWCKMTSQATDESEGEGLNNKKAIAIILDGRAFSYPRVQQPICNGSSVITGLDDIYEATDLANILSAGKLDASARIIEEQVVGPSLSAASIKSGLQSLGIGFLVVIMFMIAYYSTSGVVSVMALLFNILVIIGAIAGFSGASLTLPGIAGIVLTIGMAVDANVIIFERVREELAKGKGIRLALVDGYKHSYSAIIDANVTTGITALILLFFGLGPVRGFAVVLFIGILSSLVTAVLFTRLIFDGIFERNKSVSFSTKMSDGILKNVNIDFINKRKIAYAASGTLVVLGIASFFLLKFNLGVDFSGGRRYIVAFDQTHQVETVEAQVEEQFPDAANDVKTVGPTGSKHQITTAYMINNPDKSLDTSMLSKLHNGMKSLFLSEPTRKSFIKYNLESQIKVDGSIADDIRKSSWRVALLAALGIFLYLLIRFRKWQFGVGAIAAVLHDVVIILMLFSVFKDIVPWSLEIDQAIVAALLTIIGYSINDTVVVFDRIREYMNLHPTTSLSDNVNGAINSTLSRTLMTSVTTLLVVIILFLFGGPSIKGFSFALIIGVLVGTYSSIFIASPITLDLLKMESERKESTSTSKKK